MKRTRAKRRRTPEAMSLIELIFAAAIVSVAAAGISSLVLLNGITNQRVVNKVDNLNAARTVIERMGSEIREAQMVGGQFGIVGANPNPPPAEIVYSTDYFPSPQNPLYGAGQAPPGGWPASPWPPPPYVLSNTCLVVQLPVFYVNPVNDPHDPAYNPNAARDPNNGFPTKIAAGSGNPAAATPFPNTDALVYQVLPDPAMPGEFILQMAVIPGLPPPAPAKQRPIINPPQTILKGIVGPINPATGAPQVFQFLDKTDPTGTPQQAALGANCSNITGVLINLETKCTLEGKTAPSIVSLGCAFYMRNNAVATP